MAKESGSTRIPRFDTMNGAQTTRIPLPGSLRIQQSHIVPPNGLMQPTKIISTTKIARPSSLSGLRQPISTIASIKKSLTSEKFTEAANLVSQKTTTVVKKFLTKPEKYEKNIETKAAISEKQHQQQERTTNLEKGSKESSNEKLASSQVAATPSTKHEKRTILTRSETFVRDETTTDILCHTYDINTDCDEISVNNNTTTTNAVVNSTKILNKTQRYSLFDIPKDLIQSTPRLDNVKLKMGNTYTSNNQTVTINNKTQEVDPVPLKICNLTHNLEKTTTIGNADAFLTKTFEKTCSENLDGIVLPVVSPMKPLRRSETFSQIPGTDDDPLLDENYFNETITCERLNDISNECLNATLTISGQDLSNEYLDSTIIQNFTDINESILNKTLIIDNTLTALLPDKKDMKLQLNSTIQKNPIEKLLDFTISPRNNVMNITKGMLDSPQFDLKHQTALLYMSPQTELRHSILAPRKASSRTSLAKTPDDLLESMDVDQYGNVFDIPLNVKQALSMNALQELKQTTKPRFSFGLDLTESTLDCSIELCDISLASNAASASTGVNVNNCNGNTNSNYSYGSSIQQIESPGTLLKKQNSFDLDESLGILTPDQMKEFLDSTTTNNTNNLDLPGLIAHHSSGAMIPTNFSIGKIGSKLSLHQMRIDLTPSPEDLPLDPVEVKTDVDILMSLPPHNTHNNNNNSNINNSTSSSSCITQSQVLPNSNTITYTELSQTDTDSKTDQMTKSNTSKVSTSFITSVTSITSLDNGYQGDGEMSRPASRGGDHSPSNGPKNKNHISRQPSFNNQHHNIPVRRQDPMTDSDFFTESDADVDIFHRGDRRAQVIDGQLYGPMHQQPAASVFISEQPEMEDSCMESSGIFTDVENRCDDDLALNRRDAIESAAAAAAAAAESNDDMHGQCSSMNSIKTNSLTTSATGETDMSPDGSTDTVKSNKNDGNQQGTSNYNHSNSDRSITPSSVISQVGQYYNNGGGGGGGMTVGHSGNLLTDSQTSSTINSSLSSDRISISTDYNSTNISTATINTTQPMITTTGKRKIYNVRSSPTSNVTSPTTVFCKPITEKRAATSPLLSAAKIKVSSTHKHQNVTNTSLTTTATTTNVVNDYCSNRQNCGEIIQKTPAFKNTNSIKSIAHSVRKSSPSRKHVLTTSSSVRPSSSSSLLSSSPSSNSSSYIINSNQKTKNSSNKSTVNSNSNRKKLSLSIDFKNNGLNNYNSNKSGTVSPLTLSLDIDCRRSPSYNSASSSINGVMVLTNSNSKINLINGNNKTINNKNTVNKRNNKNDLVNDLSLTANSSNNSSSISISTGSITNTSTNNCCDNNSPQHNNSPYRTSKYSTNKWDTVMNKIAENQKQQQLQRQQQQQSKFSKKSYNQIKSKISTGIKMQLQQSQQQQQQQQAQQNLNKNKCSNLLNNSSSVNNSVNINSDNKIIRNGSKNENLIKITKIKKLIINTSKSSPNSSVNSSFDCSTTSGLTSPQTKRLIQGATKRGRSYSKDSQQSSQSDLSLSGGSPKLIIKNSARSAKKRDVRNLSISPTDLGPPPKTQTPVTTPNGVNRTKIISTNSTQKRISPIHSQTNLTQNNNKNSPPPKKATPRRVLEQKTIVKTPLKDHNRLLSQQQQNGNLKSGSNSTVNGGINTTNRIKDNNSTIIVATNSPLSVCNGNSPTSGTKLRNGNLSHTTTTTTPHGVSNHGSPNNLQKKHLQSQQQPGQQNKTLQSQHYQKQHQQQQQQQQQQQRQQQEQKLQQLNTIQQQQTPCKTSLLDLSIPDGNKSIEALGVLLQYLVYDLDAFVCPSIKEDYSQSQKNLFQTQSLLDDARTACSDLQDQLSDKDHFYMTREQELQTLHRCELTKVETSLKDFQTNANERIAFLELELSRKDEEHIKKFNSLQQKSDSKIQQLEKDLERARSIEIDLLKRIEILITNENELRDRIQEAEDSFTERLQVSVQLERDLADKVTTLTRQLELTRLESEKRERELEEKLNLSQNELTIIRNNQNFMVSLNNSSSSSITSSPLNQQQQQNSSSNFNNDDDIIKLRSPKTISQIHGGGSHNNVMSLSMSSNSSSKVQMLENEVESLRSVMDIKLNDICELRKKNQELTRANEEFEALKIKYSGMESRLEDLQIQLRAKDEEKQELLFKIKHLQEQCAQEAKNRTRVLLHNEELQYRLKQNSEKFNAFVAELSKSEYASCSKGLLSQDNLDLSQISSLNSNTSINNTPLRSNGGSGNIISGLTFEEEDSPPGSPIIKGVVKKSDSVSWVLQMDDELPEVVASRMVKRAGSFRSSFNEKVQNAKRQLSLPTGPGSLNGSNHCSPNINPLQQSASATMLNPQNHQKIVTQQRQHSNSESEYGSISSPRIRSKSINIKGCDQKKQLKQTSSGSVSKKTEVPGLWKEPICSSSPYARYASKFQKTSHSPPKSQLTSTSSPLVQQISKSYSQDEDDINDTVCKNNDDGAGSFSGKIYNRKNSRHLITCDKTALTTTSTTQNERLSSSSSSSSLPTHASVQDLKSLKKSQPQIQESAGEAMVSGTNSEDESCSGSSDESPCQSQSMSSDTNSSNSNSESDHHHHHHHQQQQHKINSLAIEEVLLLDKYANSLDGTPMEVSWSSDADAFPPESIV